MIKKIFVLTLLMGFLFPSFVQARRPKLVVMEITDENDLFTEEELENAAEYLRGKFAASGKFVVIAKERQQKKEVAMMRKESYKICRAKSCQIPLGQSLSADTLLTGKITHFLGRYTFTVELIDLAQEATVEAASYNFMKKEETLAVLDRIVDKLSGTKKKVVVAPSPQPVQKAYQPPVYQAQPQSHQLAALSDLDKLNARNQKMNITWKKIEDILKNDSISNDNKSKIITEFVKKYPKDNLYLKKAEELVSIYENSEKLSDRQLKHRLNRESYRTKTEWFSFHVGGGNYGIGGSLSLFTLRWKYFYWEMLRFDGSYFNPEGEGYRCFVSNGKTMIGFPLFFTENNRHELRFGSGMSWGMSYRHDDDDDDVNNFYSFFNIALEVSYVFHVVKSFAFQIGISIDLPVQNEKTEYRDALTGDYKDKTIYYPLFVGFIGFRI